MKEPVIVNTKVAKYMPKFVNPIYRAAQAQKEELREEILRRIKRGDFQNGLYPLIKNINLTNKEIYEIFECWQNEGHEALIFLYELLLLTNDLEQIKKADEYLKVIQSKEKGMSR